MKTSWHSGTRAVDLIVAAVAKLAESFVRLGRDFEGLCGFRYHRSRSQSVIPLESTGWSGVRLGLVGMVTLILCQMGTAADDLAVREQSALNQAAKIAAASVVQIETVGGLEKVGRVLASTGPTSGVIVSADGYIISSAFNFITQPASIIVTLSDGSKHAASIVSRDRSRMLVLLKIETDQRLSVPTAVPRDEMRVGQWTIAVGKTYDDAVANVSIGILSADDRIWGRAIQTDAKVSPVNYGGALVDIRGRVLGILVPLSNQSSSEVAGAELYDSGIGFAIPLIDVLEQLDRMKSGEELKPGLVGITSRGQSLYNGPVVIATCPIRSPAAEAGLMVGDEIVSVNGLPVRHQADMKQALGRNYAGDIVEIVAKRDGKELAARVELTDHVAPYQQPDLGILPERTASESGVIVRYVFEESPAAKAGLQPNDRLIALDGEAIVDAGKWREALMVLEPNQTVNISWQRNDQEREADIKLASLIDEFRVPQSIPTPVADDATTEIVEIKVPEEKMQSRALVPAATSPGLLVWLPAMSAHSDDALREKWAVLAAQHQFIVLFPKPANKDRWEPAELLVVRKLMDETMRRYDVDRNRVALAGVQTGGAVAYRLSALNRDVVRGVSATDVGIPRRTPLRGNDPIERISFVLFSVADSDSSKPMAANAEALRALKLPVAEQEVQLEDRELPREAREIIARWCDALGRL